MQPDRPIPVVDFYGETESWSTSDLVHIEPLIERSQLYDWKIRPHRHSSLTQLFWVRKGGGIAHLDAISYELSAPCVLIVPEMCVHDFAWMKHSAGFVLSIAAPLANELSQELTSGSPVFGEPVVVEVPTRQDYADTLFAEIHDEHRLRLPMTERMLESLIRTLTIWLLRRIEPRSTTADRPRRAGKHFGKFTALVDKHYKSHRTVESYANEIGITPSHLNAICQELAGTSALAVIHERLFLAARRSLVYTEKTITGVSHSLGFSDPAYFTRFFKRQAGMAPGQFRRQSGTTGAGNNHN